MLLYCHSYHRYIDAAKHEERIFEPGSVRDVEDGLGRMLVAEHPSKFCDVSGESEPSAHTCEKTPSASIMSASYSVTVIAAPPEDREMKPKVRYSPQKRHLIKEARKRSRTARMQTREV